MSNDGRECGSEVLRRDMNGGKGGSRVGCCGVSRDGGWMMDDGCLYGGWR